MLIKLPAQMNHEVPKAFLPQDVNFSIAFASLRLWVTRGWCGLGRFDYKFKLSSLETCPSPLLHPIKGPK